MATMILDELIRSAQAFAAARREAVIYGLLCRWISETEPCIICGPDHEVLGLGAPDGTIYVSRA